VWLSKVGDLGDSMKTVERFLTSATNDRQARRVFAADLVNMNEIQEKESEKKGARTGGTRRIPGEPGCSAGGDARGAISGQGNRPCTIRTR